MDGQHSKDVGLLATESFAGRTMLLPESLHDLSDAMAIMSHGDAAIFHRCIRKDLSNVEFCTNVPCLAFVLRGEETFTTPDDEIIPVRPDEMILIGQRVCMLSDFVGRDGPLEALLFFFDKPTIDSFLSRRPVVRDAGQTRHRPFRIAANQTISRYMHSLRIVYDMFAGSPDLVRTKLLELLFLIDAVDTGGRLDRFLTVESNARARRNIAHLMRQHRYHNLSVRDFAALSGRSPASFNRDFKRAFGMPPSRWLTETRLDRALDLVRETDLSITAIALEVGYQNTSHFIEVFRTRFGRTPKKVRMQQF
ncbi:MAG: AraC family transcriptional regulator [Pseudomonadota bacterium]